MKKTYLMAIGAAVVLLILLGAGYWYWQPKKTSQPTQSSGEILPAVSTNPLNNKPDINPVDKTNPFRSLKTNPFE